MAVNRRQKENDTFSDIAHTLPIEENAKELDKASILRIAIHYLRLRDILADCETESTMESCDSDDNLSSTLPNFSKDVLQALDGFMLLVSKEGKVLFASESIAQYLGLRQVDVIGIDLQDVIHPQDFMDVAAIFQSQGHDVGPEVEMESLGDNHLRRNFVVRMRCAFTPSVRSVTRCSNFKPIYCSAFLKFSNKKVKEGEFLGMAVLCKLASAMKVKELCVGAYFKTKHSLDLAYTAIDTRIRWILGFDPARMVGAKAYDYFHPEDLLATSSCHTNLLTQGHSHSPCYRFMTQGGDWVWVRSKSCVTYDPVTHLPSGLSIYTWIVRFNEEDERMKVINEGKDPGNLGVKDTSKMALPANMNVQGLCDPKSSSPLVSPMKRPAKAPLPTMHTVTSNPQSNNTNLNSQSCSHSHSPSHSHSHSPSHVSSSPIAVSPELSSAPPNVNPFHTQQQQLQIEDGSPSVSSSASSSFQSYDISSPKGFLGDPFLGVSMLPSANVGFNSNPVTTMKPCHYKLENISQSSFDSQKETSPPYTTCSGATVYNYSTPSPEMSVSHSLSPGTESGSSPMQNYQHQQTFSDMCPPSSSYSTSQQYSPHYGSHSPYSGYGNSSPYSSDSSCGGGAGFVPSPPQSQVGMGSFAVEATTMYLPLSQSFMTTPNETTPMVAQNVAANLNFGYTTQNIKQEPTFYDSQHYGNPTAFLEQPQSRAHKHDSYVAHAKARYASVAVAGKQFQGSSQKPTQQEDAVILGISQWLQQGSTPVH